MNIPLYKFEKNESSDKKKELFDRYMLKHLGAEHYSDGKLIGVFKDVFLNDEEGVIYGYIDTELPLPIIDTCDHRKDNFLDLPLPILTTGHMLLGTSNPEKDKCCNHKENVCLGIYTPKKNSDSRSWYKICKECAKMNIDDAIKCSHEIN